MKRLLCLVLCFVLVGSAALAAPEPPEVTAESVVLMERETGTILAEKNSHEQLCPASVTKIMSLILIMEAIDNGTITLDTEVTVGEGAAGKGGSQIFLEVGEVMRVEDLLKSIVVASANDATTAMAEHLAGSEEAFVGRMNEKAQSLGMNDTHFVNCTGLDAEGHVTSAYDIALMSRELLRHELIKNYTTIWMDTVRNGEFGLSNTNKLIRFYNGATGLKTGFTNTAGYCISATAQRDGMELICAIMKESTSDARTATAKAMLDFGFANYALVSVTADTVLLPIPVVLGELAEVQPELQAADKVLLEKAQTGELTRELELVESVEAPVEEGQVLGKMTLKSPSGVLAEVNVVAGHGVERLSLWKIFNQYLQAALGCGA